MLGVAINSHHTIVHGVIHRVDRKNDWEQVAAIVDIAHNMELKINRFGKVDDIVGGRIQEEFSNRVQEQAT
jgi:hypothetical protein